MNLEICEHSIFLKLLTKKRMFADFYTPTLSNDMQIDVQKNHFRGVKFCTEVWTLLKTASYIFLGFSLSNSNQKVMFFIRRFIIIFVVKPRKVNFIW